jgi:hypothetical protein
MSTAVALKGGWLAQHRPPPSHDGSPRHPFSRRAASGDRSTGHPIAQVKHPVALKHHIRILQLVLRGDRPEVGLAPQTESRRRSAKMASMIEIARIYEEFDVDEEDGRRFTRETFGAAGDAWATVYGVDLTYSSPGKPLWTHRFLKALGRAVGPSGRSPVRVPFSGSF